MTTVARRQVAALIACVLAIRSLLVVAMATLPGAAALASAQVDDYAV